MLLLAKPCEQRTGRLVYKKAWETPSGEIKAAVSAQDLKATAVVRSSSLSLRSRTFLSVRFVNSWVNELFFRQR